MLKGNMAARIPVGFALYPCMRGQRSGRQGLPCRPVCEKKLYEKHLLFTELTIQMKCEGFMVEM